MAAGRRLFIAQQASVVWLFMDENAEIGYELGRFVETGELGRAEEAMPYNPQVFEEIYANGLWAR